MFSFEFVGFVLSAAPIIFSRLDQVLRSVSWLTEVFHSLRHEYGILPTAILGALFPDALSVMAKVEENVILGRDDEVLAFMSAYTSSFNMIGIAVSLE